LSFCAGSTLSAVPNGLAKASGFGERLAASAGSGIAGFGEPQPEATTASAMGARRFSLDPGSS
jgi:hypothetical protein